MRTRKTMRLAALTSAILFTATAFAAPAIGEALRVHVRLFKSDKTGSKFSTFKTSKPFDVSVRVAEMKSAIPSDVHNPVQRTHLCPGLDSTWTRSNFRVP